MIFIFISLITTEVEQISIWLFGYPLCKLALHSFTHFSTLSSHSFAEILDKGLATIIYFANTFSHYIVCCFTQQWHLINRRSQFYYSHIYQSSNLLIFFILSTLCILRKFFQLQGHGDSLHSSYENCVVLPLTIGIDFCI